jgi:hypothetical protein
MASAVNTEGKLGTHSYTAASGNRVSQFFCPECGTPLYGQSEGRPDAIAVKLGVIDQPHHLKPQIALWTSEAPDWANIDPRLTQFTEGPQ